MPIAFFRAKPIMIFRVLITVGAAFLIAFGPNYQKIAYQNTPAQDYNYGDNAGYPAGEGYTVVNSAEEARQYDNFVIEINVENLEETHIYKYILEKQIFRGAFNRVLNNNLSEYGIGQYYIATLKSGEKVILFLDDTALSLPKSGKVILPVGKPHKVKKTESFKYMQEKYQLTDENAVWYVDMAGRWREGEQSQKLERNRWTLWMGVVLFMIAAQVIIHIKYNRRKNQTNE